ncbi:hypothetical protein FTUN_3847 [Frigoriglobus tundricola]|uniref:Uncharacterized protein n=1 Tax=Frigoriglobus tundricola TaxID=2774151 RepID=A0A6M5YS76_9BACT|nr:hypothetical protein FTUN_3847 [Frigoriglobus tundricola]
MVDGRSGAGGPTGHAPGPATGPGAWPVASHPHLQSITL